MSKHAALLKQILFFGIVGVITLCIDVGVTTLLYSVAHLPAYLASAIGFLSGFFFNFPINRKKVFHHSDQDRFGLSAQVVMFISLSLFNLVATSLMVELLVSQDVAISIAKILVTALIAVWNFILFKSVIFSKADNR